MKHIKSCVHRLSVYSLWHAYALISAALAKKKA